MADFNKPVAGDTYVSVLQSIRDLFADNIKMLDGTGSTNVPTNAIRWSSTNKRWEKYNGTAWNELIPKATDKYDINVDRLDGYDAGNASGNIPVSNGTVNTNLNADMLDGNHASSFVLAPPQGQGGVRRLYRNDSTDNHNVQTYWTGTRWRLKGYINDTFHAEAEVAYADSAGSIPWGSVTSKPAATMYYQGFTLDANTMDPNATGFTYSVNAPYNGPIVRVSAGGSYDMWLNAPYGDGAGLAFRTRNGDSATLNPWYTVWGSHNFDPSTKANVASPSFTGNVSIAGVLSSLGGFSPFGGWARLTPNLHLNAGSGYSVILNWDNGTTGTGQALRVGNGAGSDAAYVRADGCIWASQYGFLHDRFAHITPVAGQADWRDTGARPNCGNINCNQQYNDGYEVFNAGSGQMQIRAYGGYRTSWNCNCNCCGGGG